MTGKDNEHFDVVGVGLATWDLLFQLSGSFTFDENPEVVDFNQEGGGPASTGVVAASKLGAEACFISKVGDDSYGDLIERDLERYDVKPVLKRESGSPSRLVAVLVDEKTGERVFMSGTKSPEPEKEDIPPRTIGNSGYLLVDQYNAEAAIRAAEIGRKKETRIVADVEVLNEQSEKLISLTDILIVPKKLAASYGSSNIEDTAKDFLKIGPNVAIVTLGEEGCILAHGDRVIKKEGYSVEVEDTTGAGDVFHGAYIVGLLNGYNYESSAEFASAASALNCIALGGRSGIPSYEEVLEFLSKRSPDW